VSTNNITGDALVSKIGNKRAFDENYDRIFRKKGECEMLSQVAVLGILNSSGFDNINADTLPKFMAVAGKSYRAGIAAERARVIELFAHQHKGSALPAVDIIDKINGDGYRKK